MRVEFIELLRCPANHESSPLVTVCDARDGEHLLDATLGCVVCGARYLLRAGVLWLSETLADATVPASTAQPASDPMRLAAFLGLVDATCRGLLCGAPAGCATAIEAMTDSRCVGINPPSSHAGASAGEMRDAIRMTVGRSLPFAPASFTGLAVDLEHVTLLTDATRVVRPAGRLLAPASAAVPPGCRELARDAAAWVAEVGALETPPIPLGRGLPRDAD